MTGLRLARAAGALALAAAAAVAVAGSAQPWGEMAARVTQPGDYAVLIGSAGQRPATWAPCAPVRYQVNVDAVAPDQRPARLAEVRAAAARLAAATGLDLRDAGTTHLVPQSGSADTLPPGVDVLIGWASTGQTDLLSGPQAGNTRVVATWTDGAHRIGGAVVALDVDSQRLFAPGFSDSGPSLGGLVLHELGHAVGLDHAEGPDQVMSTGGSYRAGAVLREGDLAGLGYLYPPVSCERR